MKQHYTYAECYRILDVNPVCSRDELRRAYKLQIHHWHPDKFADKSAEKNTADDKIKCITTAHQQLVIYYREHGKLPLPETADAPRKLPQPEVKERKRAPINHSTQHSTRHSTQRSRQPPRPANKSSGIAPILGAMIVVVVLVWFYAPSEQLEPGLKQVKPLTVSNSNKAETLSIAAQPVLAQQLVTAPVVAEEFITYGSSIGEVISIQGTPTSTEGDTWYYAESELHFEAGKVVSWRHAGDSRLKTGITTKIP